jgi:hypothetical protein
MMEVYARNNIKVAYNVESSPRTCQRRSYCVTQCHPQTPGSPPSTEVLPNYTRNPERPPAIIKIVTLSRHAYALSTDLLSHLNLKCLLFIVVRSYFSKLPLNHIAYYYFIIKRNSVGTTAPYFFALKFFRRNVTVRTKSFSIIH